MFEGYEVKVDGRVIAEVDTEQGCVTWYEPMSRTYEWQCAVQKVLDETCGDTYLVKWGNVYMLNYDGAGYTLPFQTGVSGQLNY